MFKFIPHLIELRSKLIRILILFTIIAIPACYFANELFDALAKPLLAKLPTGSQLIATSVTSPFLIPLKFAIVIAMLINIPHICYQLWSFMAPGLYKQEKKSIIALVLLSAIFFYAGVAFANWVLCPLALGFFSNTSPNSVAMMTDINHYLNFMLSLWIGAGIAFQVPIITLILIKMNWLSIAQCQALRPYIIVATFTLGMLLTPPDVLSQLLLAIPMWLLFEITLFYAKYTRKNVIK